MLASQVTEGVADHVPEVIGQDIVAVPGIEVSDGYLKARSQQLSQPGINEPIDDLLVQTRE